MHWVTNSLHALGAQADARLLVLVRVEPDHVLGPGRFHIGAQREKRAAHAVGAWLRTVILTLCPPKGGGGAFPLKMCPKLDL